MHIQYSRSYTAKSFVPHYAPGTPVRSRFPEVKSYSYALTIWPGSVYEAHAPLPPTFSRSPLS